MKHIFSLFTDEDFIFLPSLFSNVKKEKRNAMFDEVFCPKISLNVDFVLGHKDGAR